MKGKTVILLLGILLFSLNAGASPLSFRLCPGLSWIDGGDLNRNIQGWKSYIEDYYQSPYSLECDLKKLHGLWSLQAEVVYTFSPRISLALGLEFLTGDAQGSVFFHLGTEEDYFRSVQDFGTVFLDEQSFQKPRYRLQSIPLTLTFYYSFPFGRGVNFFLGCGGGYYWARLNYKEEFDYHFEYKDQNNLNGSLVEFIDNYFSSGIYSEKTSSMAFGLQAKGGLEIKIGKRFHFLLEAQARMVDSSDWSGSKSDEYEWSHTWGYWGSLSDSGSEKISDKGKLWMVDFQSEETGKSYSRFFFSSQKPSSPYTEARPAKINLNGFSIRAGIRIYL
jgi:hypothetical protein